MEDEIIIRRAEQKDLDDILRLTAELYRHERERYGHEWNLEWIYTKGGTVIKEAIAANDSVNFVVIAESNRRIFAFLRGSLYWDDWMSWKKGKGAELWDIYIEEGLRNRNVGQKMMKIFLEWCRSKNVDYVLVNVAAKNSGAIKFYEKSGFISNQIIMEKKL